MPKHVKLAASPTGTECLPISGHNISSDFLHGTSCMRNVGVADDGKDGYQRFEADDIGSNIVHIYRLEECRILL